MKKDKNDFQLFEKLPPSLYFELRHFLPSRCYYKLLTTSKALKPVLRETWIVKLRDPNELNTVLTRIENPKTQLIIQIDSRYQFSETIKELLRFPSSKITLFHSELPLDWQEISEHHTAVRMSGTGRIIEFPMTISPNLQELSISCPMLLQDISALSNVKKLSLFHCKQISNADCLRKLSSLRLDYCPEVRDVSSLGSIFDLTLRDCRGIVDISHLTGNSRLTISKCPNIDQKTLRFQNVCYLQTDLIHHYEESTLLLNCHSLRLEKYQDPTVCTSHRFLRSITLSNLINLDLTKFSRLFSVSLCSISSIILDLSPLCSVPVVHLTDLRISTLSGLGANQAVTITDCHEIADFTALRKVHRVVITSHHGIRNGYGLEDVYELTLSSCLSFIGTSALRNVKHLYFNDCIELEKLTELEDVSTVSVLFCPSLSSIDGLGHNDKIIMDRNKLHLWSNNPKLSLDDYEMTNLYSDRISNVVLLRKQREKT
jgi:hypothetical protein